MTAPWLGAGLGLFLLLAPSGAHTRPWKSPGIQLTQKWDDLSPDQRQKALKNYQRYKQLPEQDRRSIERSYESWRGMKPSERDQIRQKYNTYRQMSPAQRRELDQRYQGGKGGKGRQR
jgi:hypothetical protein